jgi:putative phosphoribosyl transferase
MKMYCASHRAETEFGMEGRGSFRNREDAGPRLTEKLVGYRDLVVLTLPRGGVPVGYEISRSLRASLNVFIARKLGAPGQPEFGIGAAEKETAEIERRLRLLCGDRPEPEVRGRTAILVDDGLATGVTARAAVEAVRRRGLRRLVLAVPVCAAQMLKTLRSEVNELVCLETTSDLMAIGLLYEDFYQVPDEEVLVLLKRARREQDERSATSPEGRA